MSIQAVTLGGGDLASGVVYRMFKAGIHVIVVELPQPLAVRRLVSFAEAVFSETIVIEGIPGERVESIEEAISLSCKNIIPVLVEPNFLKKGLLKPDVLIDARMTKQTPDTRPDQAELVIGLGPGFSTGLDCHAVIETKRGPTLGRAIYSGGADADTGLPESVSLKGAERVLRSQTTGTIHSHVQIGTKVHMGELLADIDQIPVIAPFDGYLRGLIHDGLYVQKGVKIGDVDPRNDPRICTMISEKALSIGGGVMEVILSHIGLRGKMC